jgi:RHS repeat-associated protein
MPLVTQQPKRLLVLNIMQLIATRMMAILKIAVLSTLAVFNCANVAWSASRTITYERNPNTGLVTAEISHPDVAQLCVRKEFEYDSYGNIASTVVKNCTIPAATGLAVFAPRSESTSYAANADSAQGIFPGSKTNSAGHTQLMQYHNFFGLPTQEVDANGLVTQTMYDSLGRKIQQIYPDSNQTRWRYDYCAGQAPGSGSAGVPAGISACPGTAILRTIEMPTNSAGVPNGGASTSFIDAQGRSVMSQVQQFASVGAAYRWSTVQTDYDALGRVSYKSEPYFDGDAVSFTSYLYDDLGRVIKQSKPSPYAPGGVEEHTTDYNGRVITAKNPAGYTQTREKDEFDRTIRLTDAQGNQQSYLFDAWGNLSQTKDALGNVTTIAYDVAGHKTSMVDPDMGTWFYSSDPLGQLRSQTNPKGQATTMAYDNLGRMIARSEPDLISTWTYDVNAGASCATGRTSKGSLCETTTDNGYRRSNQYDALNRIERSNTMLDAGAPYSSKIAYNADGRIARQTWPTGLTADNVYDSLGTLTEMRLAPSGQTLWKRGSNNARGQFTQVSYGNGLTTINLYEPNTGLLQTSKAGPTSSQSDASILDLRYHYNPIGHIVVRHDVTNAAHEIFSYDSLNRLTDQMLTTAPGTIRSVSYGYNAIGNILSNSDVGNYSYAATGTGRPHALLSIQGQAGKLANPSYSYDQHGNITSVNSSNGASRSHSWTSFDNPLEFKLKEIDGSTAAASFLYGSDHQRIREVTSQTKGGITTQKTLAVLHPNNAGALYFERETTESGPQAGKVENRHYLSAEKGAFLLITSNSPLQADPNIATPVALTGAEQRYWHKDHLGSIVASTNASLSVIERLAYEPFGKRRFPGGQFDPTGTIDAQSTNRGFTGHEHLDGLDFIHMNARVYDPDIGRFLSPDPTVPYTDNPQSFNRYSYVMNNPLNRYDPTGFADESTQGQDNDKSPTQTKSDAKTETQDNLAQGKATTSTDPKAGKSNSGLGFKASASEMFADSPLNTMGTALGTLAAYLDGKITGNKTLADMAMQGLQDDRAKNINVLGLMLSLGRAPKLGPVPRAGSIKEGSFSIVDWKGYPVGIPKPEGPFRLVNRTEYDAARKAADSANNAIRKEQGLAGKPVDIHEVQPVKFGGSPTDPSNKLVVPRDLHRQEVTPWWNRVQKDITKP